MKRKIIGYESPKKYVFSSKIHVLPKIVQPKTIATPVDFRNRVIAEPKIV